MVGDLVTEEGNLGVLRDRMGDVASGLQPMSVAAVGDYISSRVGGSELVGLGRNTGETIDSAAMAMSHDLDGFSQSMNDSINAYDTTESDATVTFQQATHGGPAMTMDDLRREIGEQ